MADNEIKKISEAKKALDNIELDLKKSVDNYSKETFYNDLKELCDFTKINNIEIYYEMLGGDGDLKTKLIAIPILYACDKIGGFIADRLISIYKIKKFAKLEKERLYKKALQMHQASIMMLNSKVEENDKKVEKQQKQIQVLEKIIKDFKNE